MFLGGGGLGRFQTFWNLLLSCRTGREPSGIKVEGSRGVYIGWVCVGCEDEWMRGRWMDRYDLPFFPSIPPPVLDLIIRTGYARALFMEFSLDATRSSSGYAFYTFDLRELSEEPRTRIFLKTST
ncbi:hypothetical protein FRB93_009056 [Tulasnella sp. JGI-2019a]|nr:hypothetical protein FRB93_009056 [Tulasnella sp. JGI-2019a]